MLSNKKIIVFGGTGFLGHYVIQELAKDGYEIGVVTRDENKVLPLKCAGFVGQIVPIVANINDTAYLEHFIKDAYAVVNLIGILYETKHQKFDAIHHLFPKRLAKLCAKHKVKNFVHVSAMGVSKESRSVYARTKALGEEKVRKYFKDAVIMRPSVVFGAEDNFFNMFAKLAKISPCLPLIGGGKTKFQPVFVADVAKSIRHVLKTPACDGKTYELGGPGIYSFKGLMKLMLKETGMKRWLYPLPWAFAKFQAAFLQLFPTPLLTLDQVRLLRTDNVMSPKAKGFKDLKITPKSLEVILPTYMDQYRSEGRF